VAVPPIQNTLGICRSPFLSFKLVQAGNPSKPYVRVYLKPVIMETDIRANSMQQNPS